MRTHSLHLSARFALGILMFMGASLISSAQSSSSRQRQLTSKLYVSELSGKVEIIDGNKIMPLELKRTYSASGAILRTGETGDSTIVYSNGTAVHFDRDTQLEIRRFQQQPFSLNRRDIDAEPSISNSYIYLNKGLIGLSTSKLASGSVMTYATAHGSATVRGRKVIIQTDEEMTVVTLLEGDVTVRGGDMDMGGRILRPGQQAIITPSKDGGPSRITIREIPRNEFEFFMTKVAPADMSRSAVFFNEVNPRVATGVTGGPSTANANASSGSPFNAEAETELVAVPTVPTTLPIQFTVSNSRIERGEAKR